MLTARRLLLGNDFNVSRKGKVVGPLETRGPGVSEVEQANLFRSGDNGVKWVVSVPLHTCYQALIARVWNPNEGGGC